MNNYEDIKSQNPDFPVIVRECTNAQPSVMARYDWGIEKRVYVHNLQENEIDGILKEMVDSSTEVNAAIPKRF